MGRKSSWVSALKKALSSETKKKDKARRALRGLKGLVRLKTMLHGQCVKRQIASTLKCLQTIARVQSEVRSTRLRMWEEEEHALQRQLQQKWHANEIEKLRVVHCSEYWDVSAQSKEQIEAKLQNKHDATKRRERALAYAYAHQTLRNSPRSMNQTIMDPNNPHWGWSLFERWMAARPQESKSSSCNELTNASTPLHRPNKEYRLHHSLQWPSTPTTKSKRMRPQSPRTGYADDDWRSMGSVQSERCPRYSIAGSSSMRDDISLTSLPAIPGYMTLTESAKARSRFPNHLSYSEKGTSIGSVSKRLSFSGSSGGLRSCSVHLNVSDLNFLSSDLI
ncbi:unnamed protein product [Cuscuta epithymum]|uniref:DUF4005 domain-containing protein n=1 Tax=Cuscuta epithymum TaxID=186058 RepID=A0AAV0FKE0_9ASTE|nr:unnamed protein product [Cuscuta epithymum]